jgi:ribosomal protein S18 acetylase RimI-like enzyme
VGGKLNQSQAEQIAHLLNENNRLQSAYTGGKVLQSSATYYPIQLAGFVFGSVAVHRMNFFLTEIKHVVVHPLFRRMGMARKMVEHAVTTVETPIMYATIREDNTASLKLFESLGFVAVQEGNMGDHKLQLLMKQNGNYKPKTVAKKSKFVSTAYGKSPLMGGQ